MGNCPGLFVDKTSKKPLFENSAKWIFEKLGANYCRIMAELVILNCHRLLFERDTRASRKQ